jgi:hypothetical protein
MRYERADGNGNWRVALSPLEAEALLAWRRMMDDLRAALFGEGEQ